MSIQQAASDSSRVVKARDLVTDALAEINAVPAGEPLQAQDADWGLRKLQRLVDLFNAKRGLIYNVNFQRFTLQANHPIHTIGPSGDFDIPVGGTVHMQARPVKVESWALILPGEVEIPRGMKDDDWWAGQTLKALSSTIPTALYYSPDYPLGNLYFWPVPTVANDVRLQFWTNLTDPVSLDTVMAMPPAYWSAIIYTLAVELCPSFDKEASRTLVGLQAQAVKAVLGNNAGSPRMQTDGGGIPGRGGRPDFNFLTGERG